MLMSKVRYDKRLQLFIVFSIVLLTLLCISVVFTFRTGEEATVGIFSLAATLLGTIFIAVELKNSQEVTCSDMLIDLNNYFHDSDRLMKVYEVLETCQIEGTDNDELWKDVKCTEVAQYCTFFENLYLLQHHHIADIADLDDLFGYRFFLFMNNPYIQEKYILPTSSSYVQIFNLYKVWIQHRESQNVEGWERHIPGAQYIFPKNYLQNKIYLYDHGFTVSQTISSFESKGLKFSMRTLSFESMRNIASLQERAVAALPDRRLFYPLSREELLESLYLDEAAGIFTEENELVAFALVVNNRKSDRSLASDADTAPEQTLTFDVVVVDEKWRGHSFHRRFIDWAVSLAKEKGATTLLATVDPDNIPSKSNFIAKGFRVQATLSKYASLPRNLLRLDIADC